jgi:elongation factor Ts
MATVTLELIQQLRERTGAGMMDCKKALQETDGDIERAIEVLRKKGAAVAEKRAGNATAEGIIHAYIHPGSRVGVLVEINCETDFVARTDAMKTFAQDVCLHIAAIKPDYVSPDEVDQTYVTKKRAEFIEELAASKKPASIIDQIVEGKLSKLVNEVCLLKQQYVKNDQITVEDLLKELIAKLGENIRIKRFVRFEIGY